MDACFDEKEDMRNCCPSCRYQEPRVLADQPVDWYVFHCQQY
jgi:hypothetical protein